MLINGSNSPEISIIRPYWKHLKCYSYQQLGNGSNQSCASEPYLGAHSFLCTQVALATHSDA